MDTAKYLELFRQEAAEHLGTLEAFIASGAPADATSLQDPFRAAHSIKGMAAAMGFEPIERLCHALEEGFARVRSGDMSADAALRAAWVTAIALLRDQLGNFAAAGAAPDELAALLRGSNPPATEIGPPTFPPAAPAVPVVPRPEAGGIETPPAGGLLTVTVHINPLSPLPAARALTIIKRLETLAPLRELAPDAAAISTGAFQNYFSFKIAASEAAVRDKLAGASDLAGVDFHAAPSKAAPAAAGGAPAPAPRSAIRVDSARLDELSAALERLLGLDAVLHARLSGSPEIADLLASNRKFILALANSLAAIRLVPFGAISDRLKIAFQDTIAKVGKQAQLSISGDATVLDRRVLDELVDPLLHLLRNSLDHGLEPAADRLAAGKPAAGTIILSVHQRGDRAIVTLGDDGRGMDAEKLRAAAIRKGFLTEARARALSDAEAHELITLPGFSTAEQVSELSGRGVGMDVVRYKIEALGGRLKIETQLGRGTRFILSLPITTLQQAVMLFEWNGQPFGVPLSSLNKAGIAQSYELAKAGPDWKLQLDNGSLSLLSVGALFEGGLSGGDGFNPSSEQPYLRIEIEGKMLALAVTRIIGSAELLVKSLPAPINLLPGLSGAAMLGDGRVAVMLDPEFLARGLSNYSVT